MRPCVAREDGSIEVLGGLRPAARSGSRLVPVRRDDLVPLPADASLMHLPGRLPWVLDEQGQPQVVTGFLAMAAVLPLGYLRTLLPADTPEVGSRRLPLFAYAAVAEHNGRLMAAALQTDAFSWWEPAGRDTQGLARAVEQARAELPGNRLVDHLAVCAMDLRCYTAQNTFLRHYEGALPASPACNADCLGCISLQSDGQTPAAQPRMRFAPTAGELADMADFHLAGDGAAMVSFGQGCEGEPLTRDEAIVEATRMIRARHPRATIHVNTNGSKSHVLRRLIQAGCNSVRISAISFDPTVFETYYRPLGYSLDDVVACGRAMAEAGGQVCLNLLTFPGLTDAPEEMELTVAACRQMRVQQIQWRSLNVDHDWLAGVLAERGRPLGDGEGLGHALEVMREALPGVAHGNFTRPAPPAGVAQGAV